MDRADRYSDLDDLVVRCRATGAREAFAEAVACYRAGAFRAAIIATWSAVVFDYLSKLRELDLTGNAEATKILASFERAREQSDTVLSQQLERDILKDAQEKFDLLSPLEREDLERLRIDRHRSAHPSLVTIEEPYAPPAEMARCHLRNAAVHLLSRPPLQGRDAWGRVWADVTSEYFPDDVNDAGKVLGARLSRARDSLIRKLLTELVKEVLGSCEQAARHRFIAAMRATVSLFHTLATSYFAEKLPPLVDTVADDGLPRLLRLCADVPLCWESLPSAMRDKLTAFSRKTDDPVSLQAAMQITELRSVVTRRDLTAAVLAAVSKHAKESGLLEKVVLLIENETSYAEFRDIREVLRDEGAMAALTGEQLQRMVLALKANSHLRGYGGFYGIVSELLAASRARPLEVRGAWADTFSILPAFHQKNVSEVYPELAKAITPE